MEVARAPRFALGVIFRRDPGVAPDVGEMEGQAVGGVWPPVAQPLGRKPEGDAEFPGG